MFSESFKILQEAAGSLFDESKTMFVEPYRFFGDTVIKQWWGGRSLQQFWKKCFDVTETLADRTCNPCE